VGDGTVLARARARACLVEVLAGEVHASTKSVSGEDVDGVPADSAVSSPCRGTGIVSAIKEALQGEWTPGCTLRATDICPATSDSEVAAMAAAVGVPAASCGPPDSAVADPGLAMGPFWFGTAGYAAAVPCADQGVIVRLMQGSSAGCVGPPVSVGTAAGSVGSGLHASPELHSEAQTPRGVSSLPMDEEVASMPAYLILDRWGLSLVQRSRAG